MLGSFRPTQVPWKCDHCSAKYLVTIAGFLESPNESAICKKCGKPMNWTSMRPAAEFDPLFDTSEEAEPR